MEKETELEYYQKLEVDYNAMREELEGLKLYFSELEATNNHLISATWREREMKRQLSETIEELNKTRLIVENQNKRISESINYSKKIQLAINPSEGDFSQLAPDSFVIYMPKDTISGDFPWIFKNENYTYFAAADCTGHGVPGAMMSMIGNLLLNMVVDGKNDLLPSAILRKLHEAVVNTLKQAGSDSNSNDGLDIGLCRVDHINKELVFSGAHRPMFFMRDGIIEVLSGDKFPIGGLHYKDRNTFTDKRIHYRKDDKVFLFTDGLPDQVGGMNKTKLMTKNVKQFLEDHKDKSMKDLKADFTDFFCNWKGDNKQVDDILLIGLKF